MSDEAHNNSVKPLKPTLRERIKNFKPPSKKKMFWAWVTYQAVKGTITTTVIWIPAILYWWHH